MNNSFDRSSNFELLRIILAIMIVALHYFNGGMGGALANVYNGTFNYYLVNFLESACIIAVNVFILITGYFMCQKKEIKISKVIHLFYLMLFYGFIISLGWFLLFNKSFNIENLKIIISAIFNRWFVFIYIILYLLIPYLNKLIRNLSKKPYKILLFILIFFFYVWPTFIRPTSLTTLTISDSGYGITNFITLYLLGAYLKLYPSKQSLFKNILVYLSCTIITTISALFITTAFNYNSFFNLISTIAFFQIFRQIKLKNNKLINKLASYTFCVYIIHENQLIVKILYQSIFKSYLFWNSKFLLINFFITILGIYIICVVIEFLRRILMKNIDKLIAKINIKIVVED